MKAILLDNGVEIKRGDYPRHDMGLIQGLASGLEWKLIVEGDKPAVDERLFSIITNEVDSEISHAQYPHLKEYQINYTSQQKTDVEIIDMLKRIEQEKNEIIAKERVRIKQLFVGFAILKRALEGTPPPAPQQILIDKIETKGNNIWLNHNELASKIAMLPTLPDPDSNWNTSDAE